MHGLNHVKNRVSVHLSQSWGAKYQIADGRTSESFNPLFERRHKRRRHPTRAMASRCTVVSNLLLSAQHRSIHTTDNPLHFHTGGGVSVHGIPRGLRSPENSYGLRRL